MELTPEELARLATLGGTAGGGGGGGTEETEAEQAAVLLESYGYVNLLGGKWLHPSGVVVSQSEALNDVYSRNFVLAQPQYDAPAGTSVSGAGASTTGGTAPGVSRTNTSAFTQGGVRYVYDPSTGGFVPAIGGSGASTATSDPLAGVKLQMANADLALKQQLYEFTADKWEFEKREGMEAEARETADMMFSQQLDIARLQTNIAQFNSAQNVDVQQANFDNSERYATRQSNLATQIGSLAQNPIDYARATATSLANSGWGEEASLTGVDNTSSRSLMPLEQLLRIRTNSMGGPAPITAQPVGVGLPTPMTAPPVMPGGATALPQTNAPLPASPTALPLTNPYDQINAIAAQQNAIGTNTSGFNIGANATPGGIPLDSGVQTAGGFTWDPNGTGGIRALAGGGLEDDAFLSGDAPGNDPSAGGARPELNIPLGDGRVVVLNEKQMDALGINLKRVEKMALGGIFDTMAGDDGSRDLATNFLRENVRQGLQGSGLSGVPAPVFASSPGFNPESAQYIAGLSQAGGGLSANRYLQLAELLRPAGLAEHAVRRSA